MKSAWILKVFTMEMRKIITYRFDFWANFLGQTSISLFIAYSIWSSVFEQRGVTELNGMNMNDMILYYLLAPLLFRIQQGQGIGHIARDIYDGGLSKYLTYPLNFFQYKITTYLATSFFYLLQLILLFVVSSFFLDTSSIVLSFNNLFMFVLVLLCGSLAYFTLNSMIEILAFWADYVWSLGVMAQFIGRFLAGALIPLSFFPLWAQKILSFLPFSYFAHFPIKILRGEISNAQFTQGIFIILCWAFIFGTISLQLWKRGQKNYTGVGI